MKKALMLLAVAATACIYANAQNDFYGIGRYYQSNQELIQSGKTPKAVLFGDSITDAWGSSRSDFFEKNNFVGRGISGQTTAQMLIRFRNDVISLKPKYVVILAGINDIGLNPGYTSLDVSFQNIQSMCELAKKHKIKPVICALLPSTKIGWRPAVTDTKDQVDKFNAMLRDYAKKNKFQFIDYGEVLADSTGGTSKNYSHDTVHPNAEGYALMEKFLLERLGKK